MKYLLICLMFLISCTSKTEVYILHLKRHDGTPVRCKVGLYKGEILKCEPGRVLLACDDGRVYDCSLEQEP